MAQDSPSRQQAAQPPEAPPGPGWRFDHSYSRLPRALFDTPAPTPVRQPELVVLNRDLAADLGLDAEALARPEQVATLAGNALPAGARPLAQAYAGHQFGYFTMLGDGRALLLGEHLTPDGRRVDVQLKGSGRTPFSRGGDGRAPLGPMLREHILGEAMHGLGIPTSRSLAVVATGEPVFRETPLPGAVLTRIAASHLRVGTFQYAAALRDPDVLRSLVDYTIDRHYADHEAELTRGDDSAAALLRAVAERQAELVARWLAVGFVHGVMNTDNMALSGETIDYGPCAFLDAYHPATVFSSIDQGGRYAFESQSAIAQWNLARFAEALLPLLDEQPERALERAQEIVDTFPDLFRRRRLEVMRAKLGLACEEPEDEALVEDLLTQMADRKVDFTNAFRDLTAGRLPGDDPTFAPWLERWRARLERQGDGEEERRDRMRRVNPAVIPRNHRVEEALEAAVERDDLEPFHRLLAALADPFDHDRDRTGYDEPAPPGKLPYRTFCGT